MTTMAHSWRRSYTFIVIATALIVAAADFFFYGHAIGWTVSAIVAAMFCLIAARDSRFYHTIGGRAFTLALFGLLFALVEQPTWLNVAYAMLCLSGISLINAFGPESDFSQWLMRWSRWISLGWTRFFIDNSVVVRFLVRRGVSPTRARGIAVWIVPAMLASVFVALFAWANPIISDWFSRLGAQLTNLFEHFPDIVNLPRLMFWLAFAIVTWMLLRGRVQRSKTRMIIPPPTAFETEAMPDIPSAFVIRCLILFNLVFIVQNVLDVSVLYTQHFNTGIEYRTYVRRGAYPLVAAALLAGAFVLITFRPDSETEKSPSARRLVYLWISQTVFLTLSAAWRLYRYIEMYSLTRLRIASIIWFALVALGLCYIVWRIVRSRSNNWLVNVNALTALLVLYPCCFINFDGYIADYNAAHCEEAGGGGSPLDVDYFRDLGPTSVAALDRSIDKLTLEPRRIRAEGISADLHKELRADLSDWRGWT